jgi:hypothetical protein
MNRCTRSRIGAALAACALVTGPLLLPFSAANAQGIVREAPRDVKPGRLMVTAPPEITLNGKPERLSPGSRIRDLNNMLLLSGSIVGKELPVVYKRDSFGLVHEVWVLTPDEYRRIGGDNADGSADGYKRFIELLNLIFSLRK